MKLELKKGGYAQLEQGIQKIENLARKGANTCGNVVEMVLVFQRIMAEALNIQQALKDVVLMAPDRNKGAAA